jgi:antitoxin (DNA-binding transcriptional repressor) of toxin-antitoxin stability system
VATVIDKKEAYAHLADVVDRAMGGEEIVIAHDGRLRLKLVPVAEDAPPSGRRRLGGDLEGRIKEAPGVWDPMTDDELRAIGLL